jgi:serine/threonine protein kinase
MINNNGERTSTKKINFYTRKQRRYTTVLQYITQGNSSIIKEIGEGAYGKIYLAQHKDKKNILRAIKIIKKQYRNSQFMSEALILKQLDHPNVLKLY